MARVAVSSIALLALVACGEVPGSAASQTVSHNDAFARAREGMILCTSPNESRKTCGSTIEFVFGPDGETRAVGESVRNASPLIVSRGPLPLTLLPDGFCSEYRSENADTQTFTIDGVPASEAATASIRADLRSRPTPPRTCVQFSSSSTYTRVTIEGVSHPDMSERMIWVSRDEGYTIGWPPQ